MRFTSMLRASLLIFGIAASTVSPVCAQEESLKEMPGKGMPPRTAPTEYQAHAQAGTVAIGAEFMGHSVPTPEQTVSSEEYIVVEAGLFGPPGERTQLSREDFSLRVNGKKNVLPSEPYELVFKSLKDPEWQPPAASEESKGSKSGLTTGGGGGQQDKRPAAASQNAVPAAARDGTARSKGRDAGRRSRAAPGWTAFLSLPGKSRGHQITRIVLQRRGG